MSIENRKLINRYLGEHGLSTLDDPQGLATQLGYLVDDDEHFKRLINKCDPQYRNEMYQALAPHLRFTPRPLDTYISELGMEAEAQQLPTVDEDGKFHAFNIQDIKSRLVISEIVEEHLAKQHLHLVCRSCTREQVFHGGTKADAIHKARAEGWTYGLDPNPGAGINEAGANEAGRAYEICPDCPASSKRKD